MERRNTERADNILQKFLHDSGLGTPSLHYKLVQVWPTVVDETIATATQALEVRNQTLWVRVEIPALRTQLSMMRAQLVQQLNAAVESIIIYDIKFL